MGDGGRGGRDGEGQRGRVELALERWMIALERRG